ncbi:MAG: undecaprenyldiphospho-muramoylpentapeptide beta-N-acetylglucosaminyltransferase [Gammaproteobacteria bacterium]
MSARPILVMAGGTGGHVYPALAVAESLIGSGWPVVWLGTREGLEARVVPARGIPIEWVDVGGLRGKGFAALCSAPVRLVRALLQSAAVMRRHRPRAVLGMGGYVAGPGGVAAWLLRRPLVIHEQNAVGGTTNRLLARFARRVLTGFPGVLGGECIGNPVRADIAALPPPTTRLHGRSGALRVLVLGGSQGARALNAVVPFAIALLPADRRPQVRHQCGEKLVDEARAAWTAAGVRVDPVAFIDDVAAAYAWADVVVCRAGALTVAELAAAGVASILVPLPHAVDDHQTANARYLVDAGAGELLPESELTPASLAAQLGRFTGDRATLLAMAVAARRVSRPDATAALVAAIREAAR